MVVDKQYALDQIDRALQRWENARARSKYEDISDLGAEAGAVTTLVAATIRRLAPAGSQYIESMEEGLGQVRKSYKFDALLGALIALRADYEDDYMSSIRELIHADLFSDFLEMADHLLGEGYKDPAAVLTGGVLEEHLRKLCDKAGIPTDTAGRARKADTLNADLAGKGIYGKADLKSVIAWLDLRNNAAHGKYGEYSNEQIALMLQSVRDFIARNPA